MMNIWLILILVMVASFLVQTTLQSRFNKYSQIRNTGGLTGAEVARRMLEDHGIRDVRITCIEGQLTDHYNPETKTVNLSESVYGQRSIAAAAVAAHECGHVVQHYRGYAPLKLRTALVPVVNFSNRAVQWVLLLGVMLISITPALLWLAIALFAMSTLFSIVTLPVEVNASNRAINWLRKHDIADNETSAYAVDALKWAAYTYVIAALGSLATLFYYIGIARRS
ncbi:MAG: zinc metallopeptidase [Bacteroidia bacterium]|nr:zinc metallopeptidase [Bacteroidia bacterium]